MSIVLILFAVAVIAGCFDAIAGGGGLLTVPALLLAGLDPISALGTNKLQASFGSISATTAFARRGLVPWRSAVPVALAAGAASMAGALSVRFVPQQLLAAAIPLLLIGIAVYFATTSKLRDTDGDTRMSVLVYAALIAPIVGFYDGVFGPGAGAFYMVGFVTLLGYGAVKATGHTKLANAASNLGSLVMFAATGSVAWAIGIAMAVGAFLGAQIGSRLAIRLGARIIRPILVVISCAMAIKLLADPSNALRQWLAQLIL